MKFGKAIRKVAFLAVFAVLLLVVVRFWEQIVEYLFYLFGLGAVGYGVAKGTEKLQEIREEIRDQEEKLDQAAADRQQRAEALAREDTENQGQIEAWRKKKERWKARRSGGAGGKPGGLLLLVLCMLLTMAAVTPAPAWAGEAMDTEDRFADLSREELIEMIIEAEEQLDEADRLLARETALKEGYRQLYLETEADLRLTRELSARKDEIITAREKEITAREREIEVLRYKLERSSQAWGLTGGLRLTGQGAGWTLGVARRRGMFSWTLGLVGGDSFGVEAGVTVWWPW